MSQTKLSVEVNKFSKGLIGSASPVDYPHDAATILRNMVLKPDGSLKKRGGLKHVTSAVVPCNQTIFPSGKYSKNVYLGSLQSIRSPSADVMYGLKIGNIGSSRDSKISILGFNSSSGSWSDIPAYKLGGTPATWSYNETAFNEFSKLQAVRSALYIANGWNGTTFIYNPTSNSFSYEEGVWPSTTTKGSNIIVNDSWGKYDTDGRGAVRLAEATPARLYNYINQGFNVVVTDGIKRTPSDSEQDWVPNYTYSNNICKVMDGDFVTGYILNKQKYSLHPAPMGARQMRVYGAGQDNVYTPTKSNVQCLHSGGKMWHWCTEYSLPPGQSLDGNMPNIQSIIAFSQTTTLPHFAARCFSKNGPTNVWMADPTESDGGTIVITDSGNILHIHDFDGRLVVFAEFGVWEIDNPSSAIGYQVRKVSNDILLDARTIVATPDKVLFFTSEGIKFIFQDPRSGRMLVDTQTDQGLSILFKENGYSNINECDVAFSVYDELENTVRWFLTPTVLSSGGNTLKSLNLVLDMLAFYENEYKTPSSSGNLHFIGCDRHPYNSNKMCLLTLQTSGSQAAFGMYEEDEAYINDQMKVLSSGTLQTQYVGFSAEIETGAASFGDASKAKDVPYLTVYMKQTETSYNEDGEFDIPTSCIMRVKWDFATSASTGKWGDPREVYRLKRFTYPETSSFDYGYDVIITKNKIRGRGKALRINFTIPEGNTCHLYGWNFTLNANTEV